MYKGYPPSDALSPSPSPVPARISPHLLSSPLFSFARFMSGNPDYSPKPVSGAIIGISCTCILAALPLIGLTVVSKPAHPAARATRIAWYLTGFAALVLLSSHITPLVTAIRLFLDKEPANPIDDPQDLGPVAFALQGLTLIFEIAACRAVFYATLPLGATRARKWTFIILDLFSFGVLLGTFIGALVGTEDYHSGMCGNQCTYVVLQPTSSFTLMTDYVCPYLVRREKLRESYLVTAVTSHEF